MVQSSLVGQYLRIPGNEVLDIRVLVSITRTMRPMSRVDTGYWCVAMLVIGVMTQMPSVKF